MRIISLGACNFESGQTLTDCRVGYRTFGTLNEEKSNAVLFPTWYVGTTKNYVDFGYIGPGKFADSSRFFIITVDAFSNGVSSSPSNSSSHSGSAFPDISIGDMVDAQHRLLTETMGINKLHAVIGVSMGGMQALEWIVRYPEFADFAVSVEGTPKLTSYDTLLWQTELAAITGLADKDYDQAVKVVTGLQSLSSYTPNYFATNTPSENFSVYFDLSAQAVAAYGLENRVPQLKAMLGHDISSRFGSSMEAAAKAIEADLLIVVSPQDHMVNPLPSRQLAAISNAKLFELRGECGHLAAACEQSDVTKVTNDFLPDVE